MNDGPQPPPSVYGYPERAQEALNFLDGALGTLQLLLNPELINRGRFKISVRNPDQALSLAQFAEEQVEIACATPNIDLWFRRDRLDDTIGGRKSITLVQFFEQGRVSRRRFENVLKSQRQEIDGLRKYCMDGIESRQRNDRRDLLRGIVNELP